MSEPQETLEAAREPARPAGHFPEYGTGGDQVSARRIRRAFRFIVAATAAFTMALWFVDFTEADNNETKYRSALSQTYPEAARVILRHIYASEPKDARTARYVEALAAIEEDDKILGRYQEAYELNPASQSLLINYGCQLLRHARPEQARERFREAGLLPPKNALTRYLEAAALAVQTAPEENISEAVSLMERGNNSTDPLVFPKPLWHPDTPKGGYWHVEQRRRLVDLCCAPLYRLKDIVVARAKTQIEGGMLHDADHALEALQQMGNKLLDGPVAEGESPTTLQAIAGAQFQLDALAQREHIGQILRGAPDSTFIEEDMRLTNALDLLKEFENQREDVIKAHAEPLVLPIILVAASAALLTCIYYAVWLVARLCGVHRNSSWAIPHPRWVRVLWALGFAVQLASLFVFALTRNSLETRQFWMMSAAGTWILGTGFLICFGWVYPALSLPSARKAVKNALKREEYGASDESQLMATAKRLRRTAYLALIRRYYGVLLGGFLAVMCLWFVGFRLYESVYPYQFELLVPGLADDEAKVVLNVREMLR